MIHDCDICGCEEFTPIKAAQPYVGDEQVPVVCRGCGFIYVRERRSAKEVIKSWKKLYMTNGYDPTLPGVRARLWYVADWINQKYGLSGKTVFDVGGGNLWFSRVCREQYATSTVSSYDPCMEPDHGDEIGPPFEDVALPYRVGTGSPSDFVTINWTLENCTDCIGMLRTARNCLKQDGTLIVATGSRILVPPRKRMRDYFSLNPADTHCFRWSASSLRMAAEKAGFKHDGSNDWRQNDVLLMSFKIAEPAMQMIFKPDSTIADDILAFFDKWARDWP